MRRLSWLVCLLMAAPAVAETKVTQYVVKVQEERESTRWTLTEWLRIKERMKMMDVWLAMFSDPKDRFRPELNLVYGQQEGVFSTNQGDHKGDSRASVVRGQLWLTNLISSTFGVRALNIDFGLEAGLRDHTKTDIQAPIPATNPHSVSFADHHPRLRFATANFRVFGKNIQDSSLVLKYGQYRHDAFYSFLANTTGLDDWEGLMAGAELSLYLFNWLGLEGSYFRFGDGKRAVGAKDRSGTYAEALAFIEISLFRFMIGRYSDDWSVKTPGRDITTRDEGMMAGLKVQL